MTTTRNETGMFLGLCLGVISGVVMFFRGFSLRTRRKLIENTPTSTVRGMAVGLVEVQGSAQPFQRTILTPFSKVESVFFYYKIDEHQGSGKSSRWVTIREFATSDYFSLDDGTGKVLINPAGAELYLASDRKYSLGTWGGTDAQAFEQGLIDLGISPHGFMNGKQLRCVEQYVCSGDKIYIMGNALQNPLVRGSAAGFENLCIQKEGGPLFCISDKSEKELLASFAWEMYFFLTGGPVLTVFCIYVLLEQFFKQYL